MPIENAESETDNWQVVYATKPETELVQSVFNALRGIGGPSSDGNAPVKAAVELHRRYKASYEQSLEDQRKQLLIDRIITIGVAVVTTWVTLRWTSCS